MNWNQPSCDVCFEARNPDRVAVRLSELARRTEFCAWCGQVNRSGIYVRAHPSSVPFPAADDD